MTDKTCGSCARADCALAGHVENCLDWCSDEDAPTAAEIAADLAPLTRDECEARGIRHSSEDCE